MALPPTALTDLLSGKTAQEMYEALRARHCLSSEGLHSLDAFIHLVEETLEAARQRPPMPGPTDLDLVADELYRSRLLNEEGQRLFHTDTRNR